MKCSLCGYRFTEKDTKTSCAGCAFSGNCSLVRCPNCGFDMPPDPEWKKKTKKDKEKK